MTDAIEYDALNQVLARIGYDDDEAAEYHGTLCGLLCVAKPEEIDLLHLIGGADRLPLSPDAGTIAQLGRLRDEVFESLQDEQMSFAPLLPDDEAALVPRVRALVDWCEGFLFGLASRPGLDLARCSEDTQEVVRDLTQLTQAAVGDDEDANIEESAYAELVEYVRVGAQLVFMELHPRPTLDPTNSQALH